MKISRMEFGKAALAGIVGLIGAASTGLGSNKETVLARARLEFPKMFDKDGQVRCGWLGISEYCDGPWPADATWDGKRFVLNWDHEFPKYSGFTSNKFFGGERPKFISMEKYLEICNYCKSLRAQNGGRLKYDHIADYPENRHLIGYLA